MSTMKGFQSQLTAIMEALARAAVADICGLVDDGYAVLQLEISRCHKENDALRRKLELIESILARGGALKDAIVESASEAEAPFKLTAASEFRELGSEDSASAAAEETTRTDPDVVVIKEDGDEEKDGQLLLHEDGMEAPLSAPGLHDEGSSGMKISNVQSWDQNSAGSAMESPGPSGAAEGSSAESDGGALSAAEIRNTFLLRSGASPAPGISDLRRGSALMGSMASDAELDPGSSWGGRPGMVPVGHRSVLLALGGPRLDPGELGRLCGDQRFACRYCGKCFTSSRSLETHVRVHTGERPYSCAQCGKRFTQSGHLKTHQSVHTGERPFPCERCGKRFAAKQNLRIHQQKHHLVPL